MSLPSSSSPKKKKVVLRSSDGVSFEVEEEAAFLSQTIKKGMMDGLEEGSLPLPTINSKTLALVINYCKKHAHASEVLKAWDADLIEVDRDTLFDIILAAKFLNIKDLMYLTCKKAADTIKGKPPSEILKFFNISNSLSPEEEEKVMREWDCKEGEVKKILAAYLVNTPDEEEMK